MDIRLQEVPGELFAGRRPVEIVERKGIGHPDTICDALAEELSRGLCKFYLERFGVILHHNVDKVLLWGGSSRAVFGGGEIIEPMEIYLSGRASTHYKGVTVPVEDIAVEVCERWLDTHLHMLDPRRHARIHVLIRPGSDELIELFLRQRDAGVWLSNDTSCGAGSAPVDALETAVLAAEQALVAPATTATYPALGEDVKVMGVRRDATLSFTVSCAMVDAHTHNLDDYLTHKLRVAELVRAALGPIAQPIDIVVNAADDPDANSLFLTVLGTSAESGDDGQAGRGNRASGLITPFRAMTMESVAGKNPVTHVGKLYNVVAGLIARDLVAGVDAVAAAQCVLVSQIGKPVTQPQIVDVQLGLHDGAAIADVRVSIEERVAAGLASIPELGEQIVSGKIRLY